jgi:hypothetical protein
MNAWRAPGGILSDHAEDQLAQSLANAFSSDENSMPRVPRPIQLESRAMPTNNRARLYDEKCLFPSEPNPAQDDPKESVGRGGAEDAWKSRQRLAAAGPGLPSAGRGESEMTEQEKQTQSSTGAA